MTAEKRPWHEILVGFIAIPWSLVYVGLRPIFRGRKKKRRPRR